MGDLVRGRSLQRVARRAVKGRNFEPVPVPTHHLQETEGTARGNTQRPRDVK